MKNNNPIQSLWVGTELSNMEILCIHSYLANGHDFHLYVYNDIAHIPSGTIIKDANDIIPEKDVFVDSFGSYCNIANLFRLTLLYKLGGWWVDMDTVCLKPFDFDEDYVFSSEYSEQLKHYYVNNTYIKSRSGANYLKDCLDFLSSRGHENIHWAELGVNLFSRMVFRNHMEQFVQYPECFCPVSYLRFDQLIGDAACVLSEKTYALHWWNEFWRTNKLQKNGNFPEQSLYEIMKRKYNVGSNM